MELGYLKVINCLVTYLIHNANRTDTIDIKTAAKLPIRDFTWRNPHEYMLISNVSSISILNNKLC